MKTRRTSLILMMAGFFGLAGLMRLGGLMVNTSDSIPKGLYRQTPATADLKNKWVLVCPDNRPLFKLALARAYLKAGLCPGGYGYLMKKVVATAGDVVSSTAAGIVVNKNHLPFSKPHAVDGLHRALPQWRVVNYQLKPDEVLLMTSQSAWSFDSRYFGLLNRQEIKSELTALLTWPLA